MKVALKVDNTGARPRSIGDPGRVSTPTIRKIHDALEFARTRPTIALVYGPPGVAKTTAAKWYAEATNRAVLGGTAVVYVQASEFKKTPAAILNAIAEEGLNAYGRARTFSYETVRTIAGRVARQGLILIDEAQHLTAAAMDGLRCFYDEYGIGLAYLGNEMVFTRTSKGANRAMFAQLHSRVGVNLNLPGVEDEDATAVAQAWGITGHAELSFARDLARGPGGLRLLAQVIEQAIRAANSLSRPLDADLLRIAAEEREA